MSMLDAFLNKGFKGSKCKTLLKLTIPRIKLLRNRRENQVKQMRKDIAKLLEAGQEATARIRVEHIIREENMMAAQEIIELFCELISVRLPIIESQREIPLDLKEAISSICFAAPRCADLPELLQVQLAFVSKYGKEFVAAASELMPDCGVNRQLVELLSVRAPSAEKKLRLLKEIAEEHDLDWDPIPSETELLKSHEDLLNGPTQFVSGAKLPLPKENEEILRSASAHGTGEHSESEDDFDELEFPEVPTMPLKPSAGISFESEKSIDQPSLDAENTFQAAKHEQFVPFIVPGPPQPIPPIEPLSSVSDEPTKLVTNPETTKQFVPFIVPAQTQPAPPIDNPSLSSASVPVVESHRSSDRPTTKNSANIDFNDFNDVLAAARAAAESAERAATAARAAASLAEIRISELYKTKSGPDPENAELGFQAGSSFGGFTENPFHPTNSNLSPEMDRPQVDDNPVGDDDVSNPWVENNQTETVSKYDNDDAFKQEIPYHQTQRIPSMEDDSVFTYPNLFSSQNGNTPSEYHPSDSSPPRQGPDMK